MPTFGDPGNRRVVQDVDPAEIRYAWFSKKMCLADCGEVALYEMEDGKVAEITCVSCTAEHGCGQDDMQFVGKTTTSGYRGRKLAMSVADTPYFSFFLKKNSAIKLRFLDEMNDKIIYHYHDIPKPSIGEVLIE
jgi:hypothetical protein